MSLIERSNYILVYPHAARLLCHREEGESTNDWYLKRLAPCEVSFSVTVKLSILLFGLCFFNKRLDIKILNRPPTPSVKQAPCS